jgi:hypothetical protein
VWGHGFVLTCFDGFQEALWLRRYRCPVCSAVITMRPSGYFRGFQAPARTIRSSIAHKYYKGRWLPGISRTRQQHWLKALRRRVVAFFGLRCPFDLIGAFDWFVREGMLPVSRSF